MNHVSKTWRLIFFRNFPKIVEIQQALEKDHLDIRTLEIWNFVHLKIDSQLLLVSDLSWNVVS